MLGLALKACRNHPIEKLVKRAEGAIGLYPFVWNMLLFKAAIEHVQEPKSCGWSEELYHFMMDVIHARGLAFFEEIYGIAKVSGGEMCQYGFMAAGFLYRLFVAYLAVLVMRPVE